ncbi:unnamed protein product [Caenorhabditis auriculariae]|uniref:Reverse transcriptase domain-containing protein n=1 Tax=Caenorhabditis auriculariae TaxID=2777116 RepID=A0A8S1HHQ9_9PELO|nr:unnamed protein product [Caenorhabditis auriculariae]
MVIGGHLYATGDYLYDTWIVPGRYLDATGPIRKSIGINIDGKILTNLRFSDGIVLFANSTSDLSTMLNDLDAVGKKIGFQMNEKKTQWLRNRFCDQGNVTLEGRDLLEVNSYVYLGREVNMTNDLKPEIARRRRAGWAAFNSIKEVTNQLKDPKLRAHIFEASVIPAISYATEVWPDTKNTTTALRTSYRALERALVGTTRFEQWKKEQTTSVSGPKSGTSKSTFNAGNIVGEAMSFSDKMTAGPRERPTGSRETSSAHRPDGRTTSARTSHSEKKKTEIWNVAFFFDSGVTSVQFVQTLLDDFRKILRLDLNFFFSVEFERDKIIEINVMTSDHRKVFYKLPAQKRTRSPDRVGRAMDPLEPGGKSSTPECAGRPMEPPELGDRSCDLPPREVLRAESSDFATINETETSSRGATLLLFIEG